MRISTAGGTALADLDGDAATARFLVVLTHGAGGSAGAPDLLAAGDAARQLGGMVARVTQPYRVRGARAPGSPARQDAAWAEVVTALRTLAPGVPLVQGGRSNGARVACRTAAALGVRAVIALAFPLRPPGRSPAVSRVAELRAAGQAGVRVLVVNGERDPFGIPDAQDADRVVVVPGETHALKGHRAVIATAITEWLPAVLSARSGQPEGLKGLTRESSNSASRVTQAMPGGSGRWRVPAVSVGYTHRTVEGSEVGGPVRGDGRAVRQQFSGVLEDHDAVAEQAPALLGVADNGVRRFAIRSRRSRTGRRVWAHISASWLFHRSFSVDVQCAAGLVIAHMAYGDRFPGRYL